MNVGKAFPFQCSNQNCNKKYNLHDFLQIYSLWGYIFMTSSDRSIIGLTCPVCNQTTVNKYPGIPSDFLFQNFDNIIAKTPLNIQEKYQRILYAKFPVALFPEIMEPLPAEDTVYDIPSKSQPIRTPSELDQYQACIPDSNIEKLVAFENTRNVKVFSRIVPFYSIFYLSDAWLCPFTDTSPDIMEQWHNALESLYTNGFQSKQGSNFNQQHLPYENLIQNNLTQDEFDNMDRSLYAWDTEKFKNRIHEFISEYRALRSRKNFELVCYNELINKWSREFYYNPGLILQRRLEGEEFGLAMAEIEATSQDAEELALDTPYEQYPASNTEAYPTQLNDYHQPAQPPQPQTITGPHANVIERLNRKHAIVDYSGEILVMNENYDPSLHRPYQTFSKKTNFFDRYANKPMQDPDNPKKQITEAQFWWKHAARRSYEGIVFSPGVGDVPGYYNLWKGFFVQPVPGNWNSFRNHIFNIIANGDQEIFHWIMSWMARIVQDPGGEKPGTSIVMRGGQGTGKTFFAKMFGSLFGRHYLYLSSSNHLTGSFNHHLRDALVVFVDEGFLVGDKKSEGLLKSMVTEHVLNIEQKFRDLTTVKNHINLIIASNNENIVPAGVDERRFFVMDISEAQKQNKAYFRAIAQQMNNGGREAMLYELLNWRYDLDALRTIPTTKALFDQKYNSMNSVQKFWYEKLQEGLLLKTHQGWEKEVIYPDLYDEYRVFADIINERHKVESTIFGKELKKLVKGMCQSKTNTNDQRYHVKKFPSLNVCRKEFEKYLGMKGMVDWDDDNSDTIQNPHYHGGVIM